MLGCSDEANKLHYSPQLSDALAELHEPLVKLDIPAIAIQGSNNGLTFCEFRDEKCVEGLWFSQSFMDNELIGTKITVTPTQIKAYVPAVLEIVKFEAVYHQIEAIIHSLIESKQSKVNFKGGRTNDDLVALRNKTEREQSQSILVNVLVDGEVFKVGLSNLDTFHALKEALGSRAELELVDVE